jgi:hypothetical protein
MANPVMQALVAAKVSDLVTPPRSWGHVEKVAFLKLPRELQVFYSKREDQRDREVRRCQNEAAEARKTLLETQQQLAEARQALAAIQKSTEVKTDVPSEEIPNAAAA